MKKNKTCSWCKKKIIGNYIMDYMGLAYHFPCWEKGEKDKK